MMLMIATSGTAGRGTIRACAAPASIIHPRGGLGSTVGIKTGGPGWHCTGGARGGRDLSPGKF
jgi:hypothetical protein